MPVTGVWKPLAAEPMPDDSIVEAPSLVVPLLLKSKKAEIDQDDEVQIVAQRRSNIKSVDDYVKASYVAALTKKKESSAILALKNYHQSSAGQLLIDIGLKLVSERKLESSAKKLSYCIKKRPNDSAELAEELESIKRDLSKCQESNKPFKSNRKFRCPHCRFSTEFKMVLEGHLEVPHINLRKEQLCNWCGFKTKSVDQIIAHFLHNHKRRCRVEKPLPIHLCRFCPYETNSKRRITSHLISCENSFQTDSFQGPQNFGENDFPGITSKLISQEDIEAYERTRNALLLSSYNPHQVDISGPGEQRRVVLVSSIHSPQNSNRVACDTDSSTSVSTLVCNPLQIFANSRRNNRSGKDKYFAPGVGNQTRLLQLPAENNHPSTRPSVLQHPRVQSSYVNGRIVFQTATGVIMAPTQQYSDKSSLVSEIRDDSDNIRIDRNYSDEQSSSGLGEEGSTDCYGALKADRGLKKSNFIICEICDCYTKDTSDLRSHMKSIHEVKMDQKKFERRPPLSCLKCKWRFFTDQGLDRHLLGVHGLVTSNVQSQVEQNKDSGRCTMCGKAFANKMVAHMKDVHKSNLKLAHLSYKCTICSAAFELYGLFENHVLNVHPESIKRATGVE